MAGTTFTGPLTVQAAPGASAFAALIPITDNSGGSPAATIPAATNIAALTDSSGGSADNTVAAVPSDTLVNAAAAANDNFAEIVDELTVQRALNTVLIDAVASLTARVNALAERVS